jgi:hypothetical protein
VVRGGRINTKAGKLGYLNLILVQIEICSYIYLERSEWSYIAQLRCGNLPLRIETCRYVNQKFEDHLCQICNSVDIEDEMHFLYDCTCYYEFRSNIEK